MYVYALIDPTDGVTRYVGITADPQFRYYGHVYSCKPRRNKKQQWIDDLRIAGKKPTMYILMECDDDEAKSNERYWYDTISKLNELYQTPPKFSPEQNKSTKKLIDLTDDVIIRLEKIAEKQNRSVKNLIENTIISFVLNNELRS